MTGLPDVLGPAEAVRGEGDGDALAGVGCASRVPVAGLEEEGLVEPVRVGVAGILDDVREAGVGDEDVVVLGAVELNEAHVGALPVDAVLGGGEADRAFEVLQVEVEELERGAPEVEAHVGDAHAAHALVPHPEGAVGVAPDGAVELEPALPGVERDHDGVADVLGRLVEVPADAEGLVDEEVVYEELLVGADLQGFRHISNSQTPQSARRPRQHARGLPFRRTRRNGSRASPAAACLGKWSGCWDLNPGPRRPERRALPYCATPRQP